MLSIISRGSIFGRELNILLMHTAFFRSPADALYITLKAKDRRSFKEVEKINASGV